MLRTGQATPSEKLNHMRMTESLQGLAVPLIFGTQRIPGKLIWTGDFVAVRHNPGGSSGFGAKGAALYTYSASWISLLCQGPVLGVNSIWDQSGQYIPQNSQSSVPILAAPAAPTLSYTAGGSLGTTSYNVYITYAGAEGSESTPSTLSSITVPANNLLVIDSPAPETNATGWFAYVGTGSGGETLQSTEIAIGTNWTEDSGGLASGGSPPPPPGKFKYSTQLSQWAADQGVTMNGTPMTRVLYDYLGGSSIPTLSSGQYAVDGSGNYYFSPADAGQTVVVNETFFYNNRITQELRAVPPGSPYQIVADKGGEAVSPSGQSNVAVYVADFGVRRYSDGSALTKVGSNPAEGQYSVSISGGYGTYTFNSADANLQVILSYEYYNYQDDKYAPRTLSATFFPGLLGQAAWSYLTGSHPDSALAYNLTAYAAFEKAYLGMSASAPVHTFEVMGMSVIGGGILDASPVDCLYALLTDPQIGIGFPAANIDQASWYNNSNSAQNWVKALSLFISEAIENQQTVASIASRWLEAFQIAFFYSEGMLKLAPFGDQSASSALASYAPHTNVVANLTDDDFLPPGKKGADPIKVTRSPWADAYSYVQVNFLNRENAYNADLVTEQDQGMIERFGKRVEPPTSYDFITNPTTAAAAANMRLKRNVTVRNKYTFRLAFRYEYLEPMDVVTITDTRLGIKQQQVRITQIVNDFKTGLSVTAEDFPGNGYAMPVANPKESTPAGHPTQGTNSAEQTNVVVVEALGAGSGRESTRLYIFASGSSPDWAGCVVWVSLNGTDFTVLGTVTQPARVGTLTEQLDSVTPDPSGSLGLTFDATSSLGIQLSGVTATGSTVGLSTWDSGTTYSKGQLVKWDNLAWVSLASNNVGHTPTLASRYWQLINPSAPAGQDLISVTQQVAENLGTLSAILAITSNELTVSGIEFLSYETVSPGSAGPNSYVLSNLYRGAYGTEIQQFPTGSLFVVFKDASLTFDVPAAYVGSTVYFRFTAANSMGASTQDVSNAETFAFAVQGTGVAALEMTSDLLSSQGSLTGGGDNSLFSYSATTSSLSFWNAAGGDYPLPNGGTQSTPATGSSSSPAWSFTGLSTSTTYHFGAYLDLRDNTVHLLMSDVSGGTAPGSQEWLMQKIQGDNHFPLFSDWQVATTASNGGSGGGSGGGGTPTCPAEDQPIETRERGFIPAGELQPGMHVRGWQNEWNEILEVRPVDGWLHFVKIGGELFHVDLNHRWLPAGVSPDAAIEQWARSADLKTGDLLQGADGNSHAVESVAEPHQGRYVELRAERQRFRLGRVIAHNFLTTI